MQTPCSPLNKPINFSINMLIHVLILFTLLGLLFKFLVSHQLKSAVNGNLEDTIKDGVGKAYDNMTPEDQQKIKLMMSALPVDNLIKLYSEPEKTSTVMNNWVFITIWVVASALAIITISVLAVSFGLCSNVPIGTILLENASIFWYVGIVEALFFWFIALHYIPAPPSHMVKSILGSHKKYM